MDSCTDPDCPRCKELRIGEESNRDHTGTPVLARTKAPSALTRQEGGGHYKSMAIQPVEFIHANGIGFLEGSVIKYVSRWKNKGGVEDLKKARHFVDLLIELETARGK